MSTEKVESLMHKICFRHRLINFSICCRFENIVKSPEDNRDFRGLELANGMKVLLVSDAATERSAASMSVSVGHLSDPDDIPGLAHFLEHMLFLGTEKYPDEVGNISFASGPLYRPPNFLYPTSRTTT